MPAFYPQTQLNHSVSPYRLADSESISIQTGFTTIDSKVKVAIRIIDIGVKVSRHVESVVFLNNLKSSANNHVAINIDMDEYNRIKNG